MPCSQLFSIQPRLNIAQTTYRFSHQSVSPITFFARIHDLHHIRGTPRIVSPRAAGAARQRMAIADTECPASQIGATMEPVDRILTCSECGAEFLFSAGEQVFFSEKKFTNDPKHCRQCRAKRASKRPRIQVETRITCSKCGIATTVPFKPNQNRPVLCRSCFKQNPQSETLTRAPRPYLVTDRKPGPSAA